MVPQCVNKEMIVPILQSVSSMLDLVTVLGQYDSALCHSINIAWFSYSFLFYICHNVFLFAQLHIDLTHEITR